MDTSLLNRFGPGTMSQIQIFVFYYQLENFDDVFILKKSGLDRSKRSSVENSTDLLENDVSVLWAEHQTTVSRVKREFLSDHEPGRNSNIMKRRFNFVSPAHDKLVINISYRITPKEQIFNDKYYQHQLWYLQDVDSMSTTHRVNKVQFKWSSE